MSSIGEHQPIAWLVANVIAAVAASTAAWLIMRRRVDRVAFEQGPIAAAGWSVTSLFYLLPPFFALRSGLVSTQDLGLTGIDWQRTLSGGVILAALISGGMLAGWLAYRRSLPQGRPDSGTVRLLNVIRAPIDALLHQWHWTFYRAVAAGWLATLPLRAPDWAPLGYAVDIIHSSPFYWGAWLGIAAIAVEWILNPFNRASFRRPVSREKILRRGALAFATTGLFILTRNLWLCWAAHVVVEGLAEAYFPLPAHSAALVDR